MTYRIAFAFCAALFLPWNAGAQDSTQFVKEAQEQLAALGFYSGPINGDFGPNTQAALAQFQLSRILPASGQLDAETSLELGIARDATAAGGEGAAPRGESRASPENPNAAGG